MATDDSAETSAPIDVSGAGQAQGSLAPLPYNPNLSYGAPFQGGSGQGEDPKKYYAISGISGSKHEIPQQLIDSSAPADKETGFLQWKVSPQAGGIVAKEGDFTPTPPPATPAKAPTAGMIAQESDFQESPEKASGTTAGGRAQYAPQILAEAEKQGLTPEQGAVLVGIAGHESGFDAGAQGKADPHTGHKAQGLFQMFPAAAKDAGIDDPSDPQQAIKGGVSYFKQMLAKANGDVPTAIGLYNAGPNAPDKIDPAYVKAVYKEAGTQLPDNFHPWAARVYSLAHASQDPEAKGIDAPWSFTGNTLNDMTLGAGKLAADHLHAYLNGTSPEQEGALSQLYQNKWRDSNPGSEIASSIAGFALPDVAAGKAVMAGGRALAQAVPAAGRVLSPLLGLTSGYTNAAAHGFGGVVGSGLAQVPRAVATGMALGAMNSGADTSKSVEDQSLQGGLGGLLGSTVLSPLAKLAGGLGKKIYTAGAQPMSALYEEAQQKVAKMLGPQIEKYGENPAQPKGTVRFFHGGDNPTSGGSRFVTTDPVYARDFRASGKGNKVHYADVDVNDSAAQDLHDDVNGHYNHGEIPEHLAKQMLPYPPMTKGNPLYTSPIPGVHYTLPEALKGKNSDINKLFQEVSKGSQDLQDRVWNNNAARMAHLGDTVGSAEEWEEAVAKKQGIGDQIGALMNKSKQKLDISPVLKTIHEFAADPRRNKVKGFPEAMRELESRFYQPDKGGAGPASRASLGDVVSAFAPQDFEAELEGKLSSATGQTVRPKPKLETLPAPIHGIRKYIQGVLDTEDTAISKMDTNIKQAHTAVKEQLDEILNTIPGARELNEKFATAAMRADELKYLQGKALSNASDQLSPNALQKMIREIKQSSMFPGVLGNKNRAKSVLPERIAKLEALLSDMQTSIKAKVPVRVSSGAASGHEEESTIGGLFHAAAGTAGAVAAHAAGLPPGLGWTGAMVGQQAVKKITGKAVGKKEAAMLEVLLNPTKYPPIAPKAQAVPPGFYSGLLGGNATQGALMPDRQGQQ